KVRLLLLGRTEGVDHGAGHGRAERDERRCASSPQLLLEGEKLLGAPAEPAVLLRPLARQPAARAQPLQPGIIFLALEMLATRLLAAHLGRHLALAEGAYLGTEGVEFAVGLYGADEHAASPS